MIRNTARRAAQSRGGFSLIEVLVAITIIGLMVGVVGVGVFGSLFQTQRDKAEMEINNFAEAVKRFRLQENRLPNSNEFPSALIKGSKNYKRSYLDDSKIEGERLVDPWDNDYVYRKLDANTFDIISYAADGMAGGEEDNEDIHYLPESKRR